MSPVAAVAVIAAGILAVFLPLDSSNRDGAGAATAPFQYEVLSGVREEARISDGWHDSSTGITENVWAEGWAIDFVADYSTGKSVVGKPVHAVLKHVSGTVALTAYLKAGNSRSCKTLLVELRDGNTRVAVIEYVHTDLNPEITLDDEPTWEVPTGKTTSSGDTGALGTYLSTVSGSERTACTTAKLWSGAHLHQRVRVHEAAGVGSTRDTQLRDRWIKDANGKPILDTDGKKQRYPEYRDSNKLPTWPTSNPSWVRTEYLTLDAAAQPGVRGRIDTSGGVAHRSACRDDARTTTATAANGRLVEVVAVGAGSCAGWVKVHTPPWLCAGPDRSYWNIWRGSEPTNWTPVPTLTGQCPSSTMKPPTPTPTITTTPEVRIVAVSSPITEGGDATFTLSAEPVPTTAITVKLTVAQSGSYLTSANQGAKTVEVRTGGTGTYKVPTVADSVDEPDGSVTVTVKSGAGYEVATPPGDAATVAVHDDDEPVVPVVSVAGGGRVTEGADARFTITARPAPAALLLITITEDESGSFASATLPRTVSIAIPTSGTFTRDVATQDDNVDEAAGAISVVVEPGSGYTVGTPAAASVRVDDNDPTLSQCSVTVAKGTGGSATNAELLRGALLGRCTTALAETREDNAVYDVGGVGLRRSDQLETQRTDSLRTLIRPLVRDHPKSGFAVVENVVPTLRDDHLARLWTVNLNEGGDDLRARNPTEWEPFSKGDRYDVVEVRHLLEVVGHPPAQSVLPVRDVPPWEFDFAEESSEVRLRLEQGGEPPWVDERIYPRRLREPQQRLEPSQRGAQFREHRVIGVERIYPRCLREPQQRLGRSHRGPQFREHRVKRRKRLC